MSIIFSKNNSTVCILLDFKIVSVITGLIVNLGSVIATGFDFIFTSDIYSSKFLISYQHVEGKYLNIFNSL